MGWSDNLDDFIKESPDGRALTKIDDQDAWSGAYEGKYDVERRENSDVDGKHTEAFDYSKDTHLEVSDKEATDEQLAARESRDDDLENR